MEVFSWQKVIMTWFGLRSGCKSTLDAIDKYILSIGAYRTYFLGMALVLGSRALVQKIWARQSRWQVEWPKSSA